MAPEETQETVTSVTRTIPTAGLQRNLSLWNSLTLGFAMVSPVVGLYAIMGVLDHMRGRIAARIGARFQAKLEMRVFRIAIDRTMLASQGINASTALRDLDSVQRTLASPAVFSIFDIPWTPVFIVIIFIFHPLMGVVGVVGGLILVCLTWLNQNGTKADQEKALNTTRLSEEMTTTL